MSTSSSDGPHNSPRQPDGAQQTSGAPHYQGASSPQYTPAGGYQRGGQLPGYQQSGDQQSGKKKGKPPLWVGLGLLGLGAVAFAIGLIVLIVFLVGGVSQVAEAQLSADQQLEADTEYTIFTDSAQTAGPCTIFDPDFDIIDFEPTAGQQTVETGTQEFRQLGSFITTDAGSYQMSCEGALSSELYVTDTTVGGILGSTAGGVIAMLLGGLLVAVGIILVIVNRVTARRR